VISCVIFVLLAVSALCAFAPVRTVIPRTLAGHRFPPELTAVAEHQLPPETRLHEPLRVRSDRAGPRPHSRRSHTAALDAFSSACPGHGETFRRRLRPASLHPDRRDAISAPERLLWQGCESSLDGPCARL